MADGNKADVHGGVGRWVEQVEQRLAHLEDWARSLGCCGRPAAGSADVSIGQPARGAGDLTRALVIKCGGRPLAELLGEIVARLDRLEVLTGVAHPDDPGARG